MTKDYTEMSVEEFNESDHRLAGALPAHQPGDNENSTHRLAGALPAHQPED